MLAAAVASAIPPAHATFPQSPPNDPQYAAAERDCAGVSVNAEQYYLYGRPSACTTAPRLAGMPAGMSIDTTWRDFTTGRRDVTVAYVEGGINWHLDESRELVDQVFINAEELPRPTTPTDDGRLTAADYSDTSDANRNGYVDPEDLIARFSDGADDDHNGYVDDISGWDFYNDQNDPATTDSAYVHANDQMTKIAAQTDNGRYGAGICPSCTILPIKAGAEALIRSDDLARAWLYAADVGAAVIVSVTADLGYSTFMATAIDDIWRRGVLMVEASNDFNSADHQGGMFHGRVLPGNGLVSNTQGLGGSGVTNPLTTSLTERSGQTSWGPKSFVSVATQDGSTSTSTPVLGGVLALIVAAGRDAADDGLIDSPLSNAEIVQLLRATATDIDDPRSNWPSRAGWDQQFGYGRPDVHRAVSELHAGNVPPVGWIDSPDWFALLDPERQDRVRIRGHTEARRSTRYRWRLEAAPGADPGDGDFMSVGSGAGTSPRDGRLGTLELRRLPESFWRAPYALSKTRTLETAERYAVTLRLRVTDAAGRMAEDRRTITVHHDPTALPGFPLRLGAGGEAQPQLVDLQGRGGLAAVFGDSDGVVHAIDMRTRRELPGWPQRTARVRQARSHPGVIPGHEPVFANAAIADLDGTGRLSAIVTSTSGTTYVFDARGRRRPGWPKRMDEGVVAVPVPRPKLPFARLPHRGALSSPVVVDLDGDGRKDIVQAGWDGHVHAWDPAGHPLPGWPVAVRVAVPPAAGYVRVDDHKLDVAPAVADLDGDGRPELVVHSQQSDVLGAGVQPLARSWTFAFHGDGTPVRGWPTRQQGLLGYYGSAQEAVTEGLNTPAVADVDADGDDETAVSAVFSPGVVLDGDGAQRAGFGGPSDLVAQLLADPLKLLAGQLPGDVAVSFTTSGAFGRLGGRRLAYAEPGTGLASIAGALLLTGSGLPIGNVARAYDAQTGAVLAGFPATAQGLDFLGGPSIADVTGDGEPELLQGGDSGALHAFVAGTGAQAPAFPKATTGWTVWAPAVGDVDGDGTVELVTTTREGYLMAWTTAGRAAANIEWWSFRHDEHNSSRYGTDSRPPSAVRGLRLRDGRASFRTTGDDWRIGRPQRYLVRFAAGGRVLRRVALDATAAAGSRESVRGPKRARSVEVQAVDDAGNRGTPVRVQARRPS